MKVFIRLPGRPVADGWGSKRPLRSLDMSEDSAAFSMHCRSSVRSLCRVFSPVSGTKLVRLPTPPSPPCAKTPHFIMGCCIGAVSRTARARLAGVLASIAETSPFGRPVPTHYMTSKNGTPSVPFFGLDAAPATRRDSRIRWRRYPLPRQSPTGRPTSGLTRLSKWPSALCDACMTRFGSRRV